jgi:hypothetical protein
MATLVCRRCGHFDEATEEILAGVATCDRCGARVAFGRTIPRVVIEPASDPRFLIVTFDGVAVMLDREFAYTLGRNLVSVCPPPETSAGP